MISRKCCAVCQTSRSEEHTSELQSQSNLVCRLLLEKKKKIRRGGRIATATSLLRTVLSINTICYVDDGKSRGWDAPGGSDREVSRSRRIAAVIHAT